MKLTIINNILCITLSVCLVLGISKINPAIAADEVSQTCAVYQPRFSPDGNVTKNLVRLIDEQAKKQILVSAYRLTSDAIIEALIRADKRGVEVIVVVDRSETDANIIRLVTGGVEVYEDYAHAIHHNKTIVIDNMWVATGSFNFSYSAEYRNAENSIVIGCKTIADSYIKNFNKHKVHSILKSI